MLALLGPLHGIVMHLCAHARLGSSHARLGTQEDAFQGVGADWGGAEGIGAEVRKIKTELSQLSISNDPMTVRTTRLKPLQLDPMKESWSYESSYHESWYYKPRMHDPFLLSLSVSPILVFLLACTRWHDS